MNWWFKRHPELLITECSKLQSNSNYKEYTCERNNILISIGEIIIRLSETKKFPVAIIYPESYPYSTPYVIPLKNIPSKEEVVKISELNSEDALKVFIGNDNVEYLNYWHQNRDGTICLLEADNVEKYGEFFSATEVINRIRDWFAGNETGNLPIDSPEVELFAHFRSPNYHKEFLIPPDFLSAEIAQGEMYFARLVNVYPDIDEVERIIYLGATITGENDHGIRTGRIESRSYMHLLPGSVKTALDLVQKRDELNAAISQGLIIEGYWWNTTTEIKPIQNVDDLALQIGNGESDTGFMRIQKILDRVIYRQTENDELIVGIRYKNKRNKQEWQNFTLRRGKTEYIPIPGDHSIEEFKKFILNNYQLHACPTSEFSDASHHLRNQGRADRSILKESAITIIGCGALGSEFADTMAKAGVGFLGLIDYDRLKTGNSIRHVLGSESIGLYKVHGLRLHLLAHNPFIQIQIRFPDVSGTNISEYFLNSGIGVSTIANDNTEGYLNEQALINNKIMFYGRALRGGKTARIFRVIPNKDACFYCLNLYANNDEGPFINIPPDESLPTITNECNNPIRPSSAADLKLISSLLSHIILDFLHGKEQVNNHWIWSTEEIHGICQDHIAPNTLVGSHILPHPQCPYCQPPPRKTIETNHNILGFMIEETKKNPSIETGGVLLGTVHKDKIIVNFASEPGPKAKKAPSYFLKDKEYCQEFIDRSYAEYGEDAAYIGEWHYHPRGDNNPSNTDLTSLSNIATGKGYLTENPLMIILSNEEKASCTVHPSRQPYYFTNLIIT